MVKTLIVFYIFLAAGYTDVSTLLKEKRKKGTVQVLWAGDLHT